MKIKLTPELTYLIGFWRKRRSPEGLGIYGEPQQLGLFTKELLDMHITTTEKLISKEDMIYFYNTAYKKFFLEIEKEELERFKYLNEYAANYLAGIFDSIGRIDEKGFVFISKINSQDELLFLRLGFITKRVKDGIIFGKPRVFLAFIKNYVKIYAGHDAFKYVKTKGKNRVMNPHTNSA